MLVRLLAMVLCLSVSVCVCFSVTSRSSVKMAGRIELLFGMRASFYISYTRAYAKRKYGRLQK